MYILKLDEILILQFSIYFFHGVWDDSRTIGRQTTKNNIKGLVLF